MILLRSHKEVLLNYIDTYPKSWKFEIRKQWNTALCIPSLRALRNNYGPTWLDELTANKVRGSLIREESTISRNCHN